MTHSWPRNQWWVAGWSDELDRTLVSKTILGEPVCIFRKEDGTPAAIGDRCAHRGYSLAKGRLIGDQVECGYHGFTYDCSGACVRVPTQDPIPSRARVRAYAVVERRPWVWIWTGDPDTADETLVPEHPWLEMPGWDRIGGEFNLRAHFQLLHENLLDLSHFTYLHPGNIGTPEYAATPTVTTREGSRVSVTRDVKSEPAPEIYAKSMGISDRMRRVSTIEFVAPGLDVGHLEVTDLSHPERVFEAKFLHACTPESDTTTHYYWAITRNFALDSERVSEGLRQSANQAFAEDVEAMETIQRFNSELPQDQLNEVSVKADSGALQTRRIIEELIAAELKTDANELVSQ